MTKGSREIPEVQTSIRLPQSVLDRFLALDTVMKVIDPRDRNQRVVDAINEYIAGFVDSETYKTRIQELKEAGLISPRTELDSSISPEEYRDAFRLLVTEED